MEGGGIDIHSAFIFSLEASGFLHSIPANPAFSLFTALQQRAKLFEE
jgi:hypothetical protein